MFLSTYHRRFLKFHAVFFFQLEAMQSLLLEKLGPPKEAPEDAFLEIPDGPALALYEKSGRRSSRELTPHAQKMWKFASKTALAKEAKKTAHETAAKVDHEATTTQNGNALVE